jgi:hypothetical protein
MVAAENIFVFDTAKKAENCFPARETLNKSLLLMYCESRYHKQRGLDETADVGDDGRV